ncbi:hypothetical protein GS429_09895 [Natronorubrum sp. JWXQ-INN-674]|uniref:NosL family protein n=1 Tax=Natronorubrum halalkaliphilum TaxID=2691917 RepID=A0A6B0VLL4_9EURY|nr:nitrous oxide reductase accessory protein NosL [Natronorubrum halalkaliphilum]MXV62368.1 hypothetical protein [Natronorubrum halalkaliphilum]
MTGLEDRSVGRRRLLGAFGASATVGIAGCLGGNGDDEGDDSEGDTGDTDDIEVTQSYQPNVEHPGDDPIDFEGDHNCAVCNMTVTDYPQWQSQLAHEDGDGAVFDTPGCLLAYMVATGSDSPIAGAWTTEFESTTLIDATEAHFVRVTETAATDDPMGGSPRVFEEYDDAVAYLEDWEHEELTEDDIIEFDDIDVETAAIYRENRL